MSYRNEVNIELLNDTWESGGYFDDVWSDNWYTVIDKQILGENIGKELLDKLIEKDHEYIYNHHRLEILGKVEEVTNQLREEILVFVYEYLDNNMSDNGIKYLGDD